MGSHLLTALKALSANTLKYFWLGLFILWWSVTSGGFMRDPSGLSDILTFTTKLSSSGIPIGILQQRKNCDLIASSSLKVNLLTNVSVESNDSYSSSFTSWIGFVSLAISISSAILRGSKLSFFFMTGFLIGILTTDFFSTTSGFIISSSVAGSFTFSSDFSNFGFRTGWLIFTSSFFFSLSSFSSISLLLTSGTFVCSVISSISTCTIGGISIFWLLNIGSPITVKIINPVWRSNEMMIENCIIESSHT